MIDFCFADKEDWGGQCDTGLRQSPIDLAFGASVRGTYEDFEFHDYDQPIQEATVTNNGHSSEYRDTRKTTSLA